jgi:hypothetical protein
VSAVEAVYVAYVTFNDIYCTLYNYYFLNILDFHVYFFCKFVFTFVAILLFKVWQDFPELRKINQNFSRKSNASKKLFPISIDQQMIGNPLTLYNWE